jgi:hypothetical protein
MKKLFSLSALAVCALGMSAFAQNAMAFQMYANVNITPGVVTANACNTDYSSVIVCNVTATGLLNTGVPIYATANVILAPGECGNAYVYANYPYAFVDGAASANCFFQ